MGQITIACDIGNNPVERKEMIMQEKEMRIPGVISEEVRVGGVYHIHEKIYLC